MTATENNHTTINMKRPHLSATAAVAATLALSFAAPASATDKKHDKDSKHHAKPATHDTKPHPKPAPPQPKRPCSLDNELDRLESALAAIDKAVAGRMLADSQQLAASQAALKAAVAEVEQLNKRLTVVETAAKNVATEFSAYRAATDKQRKATAEALQRSQADATRHAQRVKDLERENQKLKAECHAACERLAQIVRKLEAADDRLRDSRK